ncbi:MAG: MurR/RpiR family transcriptional regulator [Pseudomonadota bacterium]
MRALPEPLTRCERQVVDVLTKNYPISGLGSITDFAQRARVSTPSVARFVKKMGFAGYSAFQQALRKDLEERIAGPLVKHDRWVDDAPRGLRRFAQAVTENMRTTLEQIDASDFDEACDLIADLDRQIFCVGGRITHSLADYFCTHMQVVRGRVHPPLTDPGTWAHVLLDMREGDVLVVFDIRRYENRVLKLCEIAAARKAAVVLFTDRWGSPAASYARQCFYCRIEAPSAWDSCAALMVVVETIIAGTQQIIWAATSRRMKDLEGLLDQTGQFRKFK